MTDRGGKAVILAVDDTPENLDVVKGALGDEYVIKAAINGMIALKIAEKAPPDLILLDIRMPGMDGFEVIERLKANVETRDIPVIFLTGESDGDTEHRAMELGAKGFVIKPIDFDTLIDAVNTTLSYSG